MKKTVLLMAIVLFITGFGTGCANTGAEISANTVTDAGEQRDKIFADNSVEDITNNNSGGFTPNPVGDVGEQANTDSYASWGGSNEETVNPLIKYLGDNEHFPPTPFDVDVDFTAFPNGEEFDQAFSDMMFMRSEEYYGKTVRLIGPYSGFYDDEYERYYHFVLVDDALGCCFRYIEFAFGDGHIPPDEYPETYTVVDIAGVFGTYYDEAIEWDSQYMKVDEMFILDGAEYVAPDWSGS